MDTYGFDSNLAGMLGAIGALNQSVNNANQMAMAVSDSDDAREMHEADIAKQEQWRNEDKSYADRVRAENVALAREFGQLDFDRQKQFLELTQKYNSPVYQVQALREAGLNPALAFNGMQSVGIASSSPQSVPNSPAPGSGSSVPGQSGYFRAPNLGDPAQSIASIASAIAAMSQSRKTSAEASIVEKSAVDVIKRIEANSQFDVLNTQLAQQFAGAERDKSLRLLDQQIAEKVATIENLTKTGNYTDALIEVSKVDKMIKENTNERFKIENKYLPAQLEATIDNIRSSSQKNRAESRLTNERADQLVEMHDDIVKMQNWLTKKSESDYKLTDMDKRAMEKAFDTKCKYLRDHYSNANVLEKKQIDLAIEAVETARKNNDYYHYNMALKTLQSTFGLMQSAKTPQGYSKERHYTDENGSFVETYEPWND